MSISTHEADWDEAEGSEGQVEMSSASNRVGETSRTVARVGQVGGVAPAGYGEAL